MTMFLSVLHFYFVAIFVEKLVLRKVEIVVERYFYSFFVFVAEF